MKDIFKNGPTIASKWQLICSAEWREHTLMHELPLDLLATKVQLSAGTKQPEQSEHVQQHLRLVQRHEIRSRFCYSKYYYSILTAALAVRKI